MRLETPPRRASDPAEPKPAIPVAPAALEYPQSAPLTRRHFRLLLFLVLLNIVLTLGGFIFAPVIQTTTSQFWQDYQKNRQRKQAERAFLAQYRLAADYAAPESTLVYEEDPDKSAALLDGPQPYRTIAYSGDYSGTGWTSPVFLSTSLPRISNLPTNVPILFLHARKDSSGQERIVCVTIQARQVIDRYTGARRPPAATRPLQQTYNAETERHIMVDVLKVNGVVITQISHIRLDVRQTEVPVIRINNPPLPAKPTVEWEPRGILRFYAGQPDPSDPSHFTLRYEFDRQGGVIDGYLLSNDRIRLKPRAGRITPNAGGREVSIWDLPHLPATRPAAH